MPELLLDGDEHLLRSVPGLVLATQLIEDVLSILLGKRNAHSSSVGQQLRLTERLEPDEEGNGSFESRCGGEDAVVLETVGRRGREVSLEYRQGRKSRSTYMTPFP